MAAASQPAISTSQRLSLSAKATASYQLLAGLHRKLAAGSTILLCGGSAAGAQLSWLAAQ